jgi:hypothetical protein
VKPTVGRIVHYTLTAQNAAEINRRRTTGHDIAARIPDGKWPLGAQAHIGNEAREGDEYPMLITRVWPSDQGSANGQVFLDGNDTLWVTSACEAVDDADPRGRWRWPARA